MDVREAIRGRRSIRRYRPDPVPEELLREVLRAGIEAPSAGNLQSRHFYVFRDLGKRRSLERAAGGQRYITEAPVTIVVCADLRIAGRYGERGADLYAVMDCAAAMQNMMLLAHSLGLGTCWIGAFDENEAAKAVEAPVYLRVVGMTPLGYPAETGKEQPKRKFEELCEIG
jgi:nitroreductase